MTDDWGRNPLKTRKSFRLSKWPLVLYRMKKCRNPLKTRKSFRQTRIEFEGSTEESRNPLKTRKSFRQNLLLN